MLDILIVDDSAAIRKILQRVLKQADVPVANMFEAGDGKEALEILKTQSIGLVLCDIYMSNMDGLELLSAVKASEEWRDVPVVMVSTEGSEDKVLESLRLGADGYVRKPFNAQQIKDKLAEFF